MKALLALILLFAMINHPYLTILGTIVFISVYAAAKGTNIMKLEKYKKYKNYKKKKEPKPI